MMNVFEKLCDKCLPLMDDYQTDLTRHDKEALDIFPDVPFLHWTRNSGTDIKFLFDANHKEYPEVGERVKYLFATADRDHLLKSVLDVAVYKQRNASEQLVVFYFDGKELQKIDTDKAVEIASDYVGDVRDEWRKFDTEN